MLSSLFMHLHDVLGPSRNELWMHVQMYKELGFQLMQSVT